MTQRCGAGVALRLIGLAELITGREALVIGLVEWAVPPAELDDMANGIAQRLANQPPEALQAAKACIAAASDPLRDGFAFELTFPPNLMRTSVTQARIRDFLAKHR